MPPLPLSLGLAFLLAVSIREVRRPFNCQLVGRHTFAYFTNAFLEFQS